MKDFSADRLFIFAMLMCAFFVSGGVVMLREMRGKTLIAEKTPQRSEIFRKKPPCPNILPSVTAESY